MKQLKEYFVSLSATERYWFYLILFGFALRTWQIFVFQHPLDALFSDPGRHWQNGLDFLNPGPMGSADPFFYQLWIHLIQTLTQNNWTAVGVIMLLHSLAMPTTWYLFAREILSTRLWALRFTAIVCLLPTFSFMFMYFMTETLLLPLMGTALWSTWRARRLKTASSFATLALLWTIAVLTRVVVLPLALACLLIAIIPNQQKLKALLSGIALAAPLFLLAAQHSYEHFYRYSPFGHGILNTLYFVGGERGWKMKFEHGYFYEFASPSFYIKPFEPFSDWQSERRGFFEFSIDREKRGKDLKALLKQTLITNRDLIPKLVKENLIFLLFSHSWPEAHKNRIDGYLCLWERWIWFPIIFFSFLSACYFFATGKERAFSFIVILFTISLLAAHVAVMEGRYRKPLEPLALLMFFYALQNFAHRKQTS